MPSRPPPPPGTAPTSANLARYSMLRPQREYDPAAGFPCSGCSHRPIDWRGEWYGPDTFVDFYRDDAWREELSAWEELDELDELGLLDQLLDQLLEPAPPEPAECLYDSDEDCFVPLSSREVCAPRSARPAALASVLGNL